MAYPLRKLAHNLGEKAWQALLLLPELIGNLGDIIPELPCRQLLQASEQDEVKTTNLTLDH